MIDLRSDTFTRPVEGMRKAIAAAAVGDDVFGEDPTINCLEKRVADMLGKEAALFVASGTMGNQAAIKAHTQPGQEIIVDANAHIFYYEAGAPALLSGVQLRPIYSNRGILTADDVKTAIRADNIHFPRTSLICLENTLNRGGGRVFPFDEAERIRKVADSHDLKLHLDGARLWNASVAAGIPMHKWGELFDSINLCFSKGLGAPVGSILVGDYQFIQSARKIRKIFGGGMRQAGILGAAAIYALDHHIERLADDHKNARLFAESVADIPGISIDLDSVETNIVIINTEYPAFDLVDKLKENDVLILALGENMLRVVTHLDVNESDVSAAVKIFKNIIP